MEVTNPDGTKVNYPSLNYRKETVERKKVNGLVGVDLSSQEIAKLLTKMCLESKALDGTFIFTNGINSDFLNASFFLTCFPS